MTDIQTQKAFQKQGGLNLYNKYLLCREEKAKMKNCKKKERSKAKKRSKKNERSQIY